MSEKSWPVTTDMTILDIISQYPGTEKIFKKLETETGVCVCCQALYVPLQEAATQFGFDADQVLANIKAEIDQGI